MESPLFNFYRCELCGRTITTVERVGGVTPFLVGCWRPEGSDTRPPAGVCRGIMRSNFYRPASTWPQDVDRRPGFEWIRPTIGEAARMSEAMRHHIAKGGLVLRVIPAEAEGVPVAS